MYCIYYTVQYAKYTNIVSETPRTFLSLIFILVFIVYLPHRSFRLSSSIHPVSASIQRVLSNPRAWFPTLASQCKHIYRKLLHHRFDQHTTVQTTLQQNTQTVTNAPRLITKRFAVHPLSYRCVSKTFPAQNQQ